MSSYLKMNKTLQLMACAKQCKEDCMVYTTPLSQCYSPLQLFPGDSQWGPYDIHDEMVSESSFRRIFYESTDGTCTKPSDQAEVPLGTPLGPLGQPRSCGTFKTSL